MTESQIQTAIMHILATHPAVAWATVAIRKTLQRISYCRMMVKCCNDSAIIVLSLSGGDRISGFAQTSADMKDGLSLTRNLDPVFIVGYRRILSITSLRKLRDLVFETWGFPIGIRRLRSMPAVNAIRSSARAHYGLLHYEKNSSRKRWRENIARH